MMRAIWAMLICGMLVGCETQRDRDLRKVDEKGDKAVDTLPADVPTSEANKKPSTDKAKLAEILDEAGVETDPNKQQEINAARRAVGLPEVKYKNKSDAP